MRGVVSLVRCGPLGCTPAIYIEFENYAGTPAMTKTGFQRATGATNKHRQVLQALLLCWSTKMTSKEDAKEVSLLSSVV